jgi:hypothetical protein
MARPASAPKSTHATIASLNASPSVPPATAPAPTQPAPETVVSQIWAAHDTPSSSLSFPCPPRSGPRPSRSSSSSSSGAGEQPKPYCVHGSGSGDKPAGTYWHDPSPSGTHPGGQPTPARPPALPSCWLAKAAAGAKLTRKHRKHFMVLPFFLCTSLRTRGELPHRNYHDTRGALKPSLVTRDRPNEPALTALA